MDNAHIKITLMNIIECNKKEFFSNHSISYSLTLIS
jgi:hypothetical protein